MPVFVKFTTQLSALRVSNYPLFLSVLLRKSDIHLCSRLLMLWKAVYSMATRSRPDFSIARNLKRAFMSDEMTCIINLGDDNESGNSNFSLFWSSDLVLILRTFSAQTPCHLAARPSESCPGSLCDLASDAIPSAEVVMH